MHLFQKTVYAKMRISEHTGPVRWRLGPPCLFAEMQRDRGPVSGKVCTVTVLNERILVPLYKKIGLPSCRGCGSCDPRLPREVGVCTGR